jgi:hypothetical protein
MHLETESMPPSAPPNHQPSDAWQIRTWVRRHATHGTFFVGCHVDGRANATRIHGDEDGARKVEDLEAGAIFDNPAQAMMAVERRILELDRSIFDSTVSDLRAFAERVAS